ncbi:hypothetical protein J2801_003619 [Paraburkholderia phenoliruptrix]|nr:hypothetical protein [Paraburkholderia phenoliruptrix]MDR6421331.1 hypothetical protein [Paraburkholderia phenoliruptrix]
MSEATEQWLEISLAWVDEQLAEIEARDEEAYARFLDRLLPAD